MCTQNAELAVVVLSPQCTKEYSLLSSKLQQELQAQVFSSGVGVFAVFHTNICVRSTARFDNSCLWDGVCGDVTDMCTVKSRTVLKRVVALG